MSDKSLHMNILLLLGFVGSEDRRIKETNDYLENIKGRLEQMRKRIKGRKVIRREEVIGLLNEVESELERIMAEEKEILTSFIMNELKERFKLRLKQAKNELPQYIRIGDLKNLIERLKLNVESLRPFLFKKLAQGTNPMMSSKYVQLLKDALRGIMRDQKLQIWEIRAELATPGTLGSLTFPWAIGFPIGLYWDSLIQSPYYTAVAIRGAIRSLLLYPDLVKEAVGEALGKEIDCFEALCRVYEVLGVAEWDEDLPSELRDNWKHYIENEARDLLKLLKERLGERFMGKVIFFDAYPVEASEEGLILVPEIISPHYREAEVRGPPLNLKKLSEIQEITEPKPLLFPAIAPGVTFAFYVASEDKELLKIATALLKRALTIIGIGAKTTSGYNLFEVIKDEQISKK